MDPYAPDQIVAVTGHRPQHLRLEDGYWIQGEFERLIEKLEPRVGISGMAIGADLWWADACVSLGIPLHAYIPFRGQESKWRFDDQNFYRQLLDAAEEVFCYGEAYDVKLFHERDRAMVDNSDILIAAWNGKRTGGTFQTREYAVKLDRPVITVDPVNRVTTRRRMSRDDRT